jgi:SAM-dependent methyltransferase
MVPRQDAIEEFFATDAYLTKNPIIPVRARLVAELLARSEAVDILDLGCGDGSVSLPLLTTKRHLTLVDRSGAMLARAKSLAPRGAAVDFIQQDLLDYHAGVPYDVVLCLGVVAHVVSVDRLVRTVSSATRAGGICIVQLTDDAQPLGALRKRYYRLRYSRRGGRNETSLADILELGARHDLDLYDVRRYGLVVPGSASLPFAWQRRLEAMGARASALAPFTAEALVCFRKRADN